jgi:hypothetical protein
MTEPERELLIRLCAQIEEEKNPAVFAELVEELHVLLERLTAPPPTDA